MEDSKKVSLSFCVLVLVVGLFLGYWYGQSVGYKQAGVDIKIAEALAAKKAGEEAAKKANPFQAVNPLEGVNANPFDKAKKALNPFQ